MKYRLTCALNRLGPVPGGDPSARPPARQLLTDFADRADPAAFAALLARHGPMVLGVCRRILADPHAAEDACQATFLVLARRAAAVRSPDRLGNWLFGVARRTAARARAEAARRRAREGRIEPRPPPDPLAEITARELVGVLEEELLRLPARYRAPLVACYLGGKTRDEAAAELGWSAATVGRRLVRGRAVLRARLARRGLGLPAVLLSTAVAAPAGGVPARVAAATAEAAVGIAAGRGFPAGVVSPGVASLTRKVLTAMFVTRMTTAAGALLATAVLLTAVGSLSYGMLRARPVPDPTWADPKTDRPPAGPPPAGGPRPDPFRSAREAIQGVSDDAERVALLVRVAEARARAGDPAAARETLREALGRAAALRDGVARGMALREVATARLRMGDVADAVAVAGEIGGASHRNHLLFLLAHEQAEAGDVTGARKTAAAITDDQRDSALAAVARAEARAGDAAAARRTTDGLRHQPLARATALEEVALAEARAGDKAAAAETLREVRRLYDATLADARNRNGARAGVAVLQARIGDIPGALRAAAGLESDKDSGYPDRVTALWGIAAEQVRQGDTAGAMATVREIPDGADRVRALLGLAEVQAERTDRAGAEETLQAARGIAAGLPAAGREDLLDGTRAAEVRVRIAAGDRRGAVAAAEGIKGDRVRCGALVAAARAHLAAGDPKTARAVVGQALTAAGGFAEDGANAPGVVTLVPAWALVKGHMARQAAAVGGEAGGEEDVRRWAARERSPFVRAMALLGLAEGTEARRAGGKKPAR